MQRPNFLFLITDQHRADHVGFGGNQVVQTPNLDALAASGTVFDQAFVANPICMPNRASIITGRMPSLHGTRDNGIALDRQANTFVRQLHQSGYQTSHIGKSHLQNMGVGRSRLPDIVDFTLAEEALIAGDDDGWDQMENFARYKNADEPDMGSFYGYERARFVILHGDQVTGHYEKWLRDRGGQPETMQGPRNALASSDEWQQVYQTGLPEALYPSRYIAEETIAEINRMAMNDAPFFIHASWPDPHHPFTPPGKYWDMYQRNDMPLPETFADTHERSMAHYRTMRDHRGQQLWGPVDGFAPTVAQFRHALAAQYGNITQIDDCVGDVLAALEAAGVADNTVVIFTSDHGDMFGDHGMMLKHAMHYEGCLRVPLAISGPGIARGRSSALVSSLDLSSTILDLAGVDGYFGMQGASVMPLIDGTETQVHDTILVEEDEKHDLTGQGINTRIRTVVTQEARLSVYEGHDHGELFDRVNDPQELRNLFGLPEAQALQLRMQEQLLQTMMANATNTPRPTYMA